MAALVLVRFLVALPVGAIIGGYLTRTRSAGLVTAVGMALSATGFFLMSRWGVDSLEDPSSNIALVICGFGFGLALAPVNAAVLAHTDPGVHGLSSAMVVVARMVGMLVGISALTTIGLRRYYAEQDKLDTVTQICGEPKICTAFRDLQKAAGIAQEQTVFTARCSAPLAAGIIALFVFRGAHTRAIDAHQAVRSLGDTVTHPSTTVLPVGDFDAVLAANQEYAAASTTSRFDGIAHAGIAVITCMDSRIEPLKMLGLSLGDAKIFRNPGGRVTPQALEALVLGVHLLNVSGSWSSRTRGAR